MISKKQEYDKHKNIFVHVTVQQLLTPLYPTPTLATVFSTENKQDRSNLRGFIIKSKIQSQFVRPLTLK